MPPFPVLWPMTAPIVLIIIFYRNTVPSLVRCGLQNISNSRAFRLYRSHFHIPGAVEIERYLFFLGKQIVTLSFAAPIRLGTTVCTRSHHFRLCLFAFCFAVFFSFSLHGQHLCSSSYFSQRSADQRRRLQVQLCDGECCDGDFVFSDPWCHQDG
jgi:hypothetical protein